ncbi:MAG: ABC transporter permease subunit [Oscillospiraceae bacterium]|jgi:NitT/TauT family transport system permease protein|nr:ABC transporter permease subunit [Oscillospiraceae bacterium]MCI9288069.1 ABC transporter permease subunit [Oscillospiraceae bacterium]
MRFGLKKALQAAAPPALWLGVWQLAALAAGRELLLPGPLAVGERLLVLAGTADFWLSVGSTLGRVFLGLLWGALAGAALAFATHFSPWADRLISPAVRVVRATPVVSFILLVYLWVARSAIPWVIAGLMVLPVVWGALGAGLDSLDKQLLEFARAYRFTRFKTLRLVCLPALRPQFSAGLLTAFGLAWKSGVAAEVLCPPAYAIGSRIQQAKLGLETADLFAWTLAIVALSLALEKLLRQVLKRGDRA